MFGLNRKNIRMSDAASESHLLKEAEAHLGRKAWKNVEPIESLSVEYWNLRKLVKERDEIRVELDACQKLLDEAHEERSILLGSENEPFQKLLTEKNVILTALEGHVRQRDVIIAKAREIKRSYEGTRMKQEVLDRDGGQSPDELESANERLRKLKSEFESLKAERQGLADAIASGEERISQIEAEMNQNKTGRREKASDAFQHISGGNQKISNLRGKLGVMDTQIRQLHAEVGKYLSRNFSHDPACRKACSDARGLVQVMAVLRKSIQYNHRLAELV